jgi:hypothetical protein
MGVAIAVPLSSLCVRRRRHRNSVKVRLRLNYGSIDSLICDIPPPPIGITTEDWP